MSASPEHLLLIGSIAVLTYLTRIGGFWLAGNSLPPVVRRGLPYVPVAAFAAMVAQGVVVPGQTPLRLAAALLAGVAVLRSGRVWLAIVAGMGLWWLLRALGVG